MALTTEVDSAGNIMANSTNNARNSIPESWYPIDKLPLVTAHMKKAEASALFQISDLPWQGAMAYNQYDPNRPTLGQTWFNKGAGWCVAGARRVPLVGQIELRGVVYSQTANFDPIITLPPNLRPAQNELHTVNIWTDAGGVSACMVNIFTSGIVAMWSYGGVNGAYPTKADYVSLSGIRFEGLY